MSAPITPAPWQGSQNAAPWQTSQNAAPWQTSQNAVSTPSPFGPAPPGSGPANGVGPPSPPFESMLQHMARTALAEGQQTKSAGDQSGRRQSSSPDANSSGGSGAPATTTTPVVPTIGLVLTPMELADRAQQKAAAQTASAADRQDASAANRQDASAANRQDASAADSRHQDALHVETAVSGARTPTPTHPATPVHPAPPASAAEAEQDSASTSASASTDSASTSASAKVATAVSAKAVAAASTSAAATPKPAPGAAAAAHAGSAPTGSSPSVAAVVAAFTARTQATAKARTHATPAAGPTAGPAAAASPAAGRTIASTATLNEHPSDVGSGSGERSPHGAGGSAAVRSTATSTISSSGPGDFTAAQVTAASAATAVRGSGFAAKGATVSLAQLVPAARDAIATAVRQGGSQLRIDLAPEALGKLQIRLQRTPDGIVARVITEHAAAAETLSRGSEDLRRSLESHGVTLLRLEINTAGQPAGDGQSPRAFAEERPSSRGAPDPSIGQADTDAEPIDESTTAARLGASDRGDVINLLA